MINSRKTPSKLVLEAPMISPPNDQMTVCRWGFIGAKRHFPKLVGNVDDGVGNGERCWRLSLAGCSSILKLDHNPFISPKGSLSNLAKNDLKRVLTGLHTAMGNFPHGLVQFCFFPSVSYSVLLQCFATMFCYNIADAIHMVVSMPFWTHTAWHMIVWLPVCLSALSTLLAIIPCYNSFFF